MSVISTAANYGGRVVDNQQSVKQFYISETSLAVWIYKKLSNGIISITPGNRKRPVLIDNDLIVTGSIYNTSDEKLKNNIATIENEKIDMLFTINPIHFEYKYDQHKKKHYGFLAQDVEKKFPELVEEKITGYKTVNYQELIPIMLAKMQIMQTEIDILKQKLL